MAWTLGGVTIHPPDGGFEDDIEGLYARQHVLDATSDTVSFYGGGNAMNPMTFALDEDANGGTGLSTLKTATINGTSVALVSDQGAEGNFKIVSLNARRRMANNKTLPFYDCTAMLIPA